MITTKLTLAILTNASQFICLVCVADQIISALERHHAESLLTTTAPVPLIHRLFAWERKSTASSPIVRLLPTSSGPWKTNVIVCIGDYYQSWYLYPWSMECSSISSITGIIIENLSRIAQNDARLQLNYCYPAARPQQSYKLIEAYCCPACDTGLESQEVFGRADTSQ